MSDLRFDTGNDEFGRPPQTGQGNDISSKLIQWGFVANREQAQYVLISVGVLALIVAFFLIRSGGGDTPPPPPVAF